MKQTMETRWYPVVQRIHELLLNGSADTCNRLGFIVVEGGMAELVYPDSQYAEQRCKLTYAEVEALFRFLGDMIEVIDSGNPVQDV